METRDNGGNQQPGWISSLQAGKEIVLALNIAEPIVYRYFRLKGLIIF